MADFNEKKATALAGYLMHTNEVHNITFIKLLKLMYFCERHVFRITGKFITGDTFYSLDNGPILSHTYNLLKEKVYGEIWADHFIRNTDPSYTVKLLKNTNPNDLSELEREVAQQYSEQFMDMDDFDIAKLSHTVCYEWQDPQGGRKKIEPHHIEQALREQFGQVVI